ncbi:MAG: DUF2318 domain-containing protein [Proteobacteria bacterium]|nr:DUF2318 domain-containing protein [Pseudomonadota bacterium]MBU1611248.1 DUF2318 domain-containing protein [Pseudomonadota bacterium]
MKIRFALALLAMVFALAACGGVEEDASASVSPVGDSFVVPVNEVSDGAAHYYQAEAGGKEVRFFVLKSSDGVLRAAFDACDVCYESKKGYTQDGEFMVCNNCGRRFHSSRINEVKGGCNPAPLNRAIQGDNLVINMSDIATGAFYF